MLAAQPHAQPGTAGAPRSPALCGAVCVGRAAGLRGCGAEGTQRTFHHFTEPRPDNIICCLLTASAPGPQMLARLCSTHAGGRSAGCSQKIHLTAGLRDANLPTGGDSHTLPTEHWPPLLIHGTKLHAHHHPGQQSCSHTWGLRDGQLCLQHLWGHGPFYSSLCWPLHVQPYVSHMITKAILTGRIIFIFLIQQPANSLWWGDAKNGSHFLHLAK